MARINCPRCMGHADVSFFIDPEPSIYISQETVRHCAHARECGEEGGRCPYLARAVARDPEVTHHAALLRRIAKGPVPLPVEVPDKAAAWWRR